MRETHSTNNCPIRNCTVKLSLVCYHLPAIKMPPKSSRSQSQDQASPSESPSRLRRSSRLQPSHSMNTPTSQEEGAQVSRHSLGQTQRDTDTSATEPPNPRPTAQASSNSQTSGQLSRAQSLFAELLTIEEFQLPPSARAAIQASYPEFTNLLVRPSSTSVSQQVPLSTGHAQASKAIVPESSRSRQLAPKPSQASSTPSSGQPNPNLRLPPSAPVAIQSSNPQLAAWLVPPPSTSNFQQSALTPNYAPTSSAMLPESLRSHKPGPHQSQTFAASSSRQPSPNHVHMRTTTPPAAPLRPPNRPDLSLKPGAPILPSAPASPTPPTTTIYTPVAAGICGVNGCNAQVHIRGGRRCRDHLKNKAMYRPGSDAEKRMLETKAAGKWPCTGCNSGTAGRGHELHCWKCFHKKLCARLRRKGLDGTCPGCLWENCPNRHLGYQNPRGEVLYPVSGEEDNDDDDDE